MGRNIYSGVGVGHEVQTTKLDDLRHWRTGFYESG